MTIAVLEQKKVSELHEIARRLGIEGFADLRRRDLIYEILGAEAAAEADDLGTRAGQSTDDRPAVRPRSSSEPAPRDSPRPPRRRPARSRQPISPDWPSYMQGFDPYAVSLAGLIRKTGVLEILPDGYGFLRSLDYGYLPSPDDIYVSPSQIKRFSLRIGDTVDGQVRPPKEGERFFALIRVHTINGRSPEAFDERTAYELLTPSYPDRALRLETAPDVVATRVVDLVAPIGKGQRGLILAPPSSGRTTLLEKIARAIVQNEPQATVLALLVDERPEDVTEFQRAAPGAEVVASTFDDAPERQVHIADLMLEKARRLVEAGSDVVLLVDSLTRLVRAHQAVLDESGPPSSSALAGPKRLLGAARSVEEGGSLTIIATVLAGTDKPVDEAIAEAFDGTANMQLVLNRDLARQRLFPAIDLEASGTRREEMLLDSDRLARVRALRQSVSGLDPAPALTALLDRIGQTESNDALLDTTDA